MAMQSLIHLLPNPYLMNIMSKWSAMSQRFQTIITLCSDKKKFESTSDVVFLGKFLIRLLGSNRY